MGEEEIKASDVALATLVTLLINESALTGRADEDELRQNLMRQLRREVELFRRFFEGAGRK